MPKNKKNKKKTLSYDEELALMYEPVIVEMLETIGSDIWVDKTHPLWEMFEEMTRKKIIEHLLLRHYAVIRAVKKELDMPTEQTEFGGMYAPRSGLKLELRKKDWESRLSSPD